MSQPAKTPLPLGAFALAGAAMAIVVLASNILVQFPINDWLTWGAFTYPVAFLVSELVNRRFGPQLARRVAWVGFAVAVAASLWLAPVRIALASGAAFPGLRPPAARHLVARAAGGDRAGGAARQPGVLEHRLRRHWRPLDYLGAG